VPVVCSGYLRLKDTGFCILSRVVGMTFRTRFAVGYCENGRRFCAHIHSVATLFGGGGDILALSQIDAYNCEFSCFFLAFSRKNNQFCAYTNPQLFLIYEIQSLVARLIHEHLAPMNYIRTCITLKP
jgi:hypothetical protein